MKILDRYVLINFLISYLIMAFVLIGLYVLVDLTLNSDEFTEHDRGATSTLGDIGSYYGHQVFVYFDQLAGIITLVSAVVTLTTMNRRNEMTAILSSGVSLYRVIWPVLILGLLFNCLALLDKEMVIPRIADKLVRSHDEVAELKEFGIWSYRMYGTRSADDNFTLAGVSREDASSITPGDTIGLLQINPGDRRSVGASLQVRPDDELAVLQGSGPAVRAYVRVMSDQEGKPGRKSDTSLRVTTAGVAQAGREGQPNAVAGQLGDIAAGDQVRPVEPPNYFFSSRKFDPDPPGEATYTMRDVGIIKRHPRTNEPVGRIRAEYASWSPAKSGWELDQTAQISFLSAAQPESGSLPLTTEAFAAAFITTQSDPREIKLRHSSQHWMQFMSTNELRRFAASGTGAAGRAQSIMHIRFTQPIINMILLLLGVPFVLNRAPGSLWEGILKCLLISGSCFILSFVCQQISGDARSWAVVAAWLPVILFGPLAVLMLDSVKT